MGAVSSQILFLGIGRNGTTILAVVLSIHKTIEFMNGPKALLQSIRRDEDLIESYSRAESR